MIMLFVQTKPRCDAIVPITGGPRKVVHGEIVGESDMRNENHGHNRNMSVPWSELEHTMVAMRNRDRRVDALGKRLPPDVARHVQTFLSIREDPIFDVWIKSDDVETSRIVRYQYGHTSSQQKLKRHGFGVLYEYAKAVLAEWVAASKKYPELVFLQEETWQGERLTTVNWHTHN